MLPIANKPRIRHPRRVSERGVGDVRHGRSAGRSTALDGEEAGSPSPGDPEREDNDSRSSPEPRALSSRGGTVEGKVPVRSGERPAEPSEGRRGALHPCLNYQKNINSIRLRISCPFAQIVTPFCIEATL